jgi:CopG family transcriptional regulator/antitoxin EndoAI
MAKINMWKYRKNYYKIQEVLVLADSKRIMISLPDSLLKEVDDIVCTKCNNRSEFIRTAMTYYIKEVKRTGSFDKMKFGYMEMAEINITLAEIGLTVDNETMCGYETRLAECE